MRLFTYKEQGLNEFHGRFSDSLKGAKCVKGFNLFICRLSMYDRPGERSPEYDFC